MLMLHQRAWQLVWPIQFGQSASSRPHLLLQLARARLGERRMLTRQERPLLQERPPQLSGL
jgi:hypothetical protein